MKVRSHYIPATQGVTEKKREHRPDLIHLDRKGNDMFPPEKVVPNKALKVKDIMDRYLRGLPVDIQGAKPVWPGEDMTHDSPDLDKLSKLDRMEAKDMARTVKFKIPKKEEPKSPDAINNPDGPKT